MARVTLRRARRDDVEEVAAIWQRGWRDAHLGSVPEALVAERTPESFRARAATRIPATTLAVVDGSLAGFVVVAGDEVEQLYVSDGAQGTGVAGVLIREAEALIAAAGHERAWLAVVPDNARARAFYEKSGWHDEGLLDYAAEAAAGTIAVPCRRYAKAL